MDGKNCEYSITQNFDRMVIQMSFTKEEKEIMRSFLKRFHKLKLKNLFYMVFLLFVCGCTTSVAFTSFSSRRVERSEINRIAILPFKGKGGDIITNLFITETFNISDFEIFARGRIESMLKNMVLDPQNVFDTVTPQEIGDLIGVDAVFTGKVNKYYTRGGNAGVSVTVSLIESKTGTLLWMGSRSVVGRRNDVFGNGWWVKPCPPLDELCNKAIESIVEAFGNSLI